MQYPSLSGLKQTKGTHMEPLERICLEASQQHGDSDFLQFSDIKPVGLLDLITCQVNH